MEKRAALPMVTTMATAAAALKSGMNLLRSVTVRAFTGAGLSSVIASILESKSSPSAATCLCARLPANSGAYWLRCCGTLSWLKKARRISSSASDVSHCQ